MKAKRRAYQNEYYARPEVKAEKGFREIQREYQQLLVRYGDANGDLSRRDVLRLEALSDYLGRDLEEWRLGKDRERHMNLITGKRVVGAVKTRSVTECKICKQPTGKKANGFYCAKCTDALARDGAYRYRVAPGVYVWTKATIKRVVVNGKDVQAIREAYEIVE